ncbi:MAG: hypothetical protein IJ501_06890 [Bacilli bacterium]|nr:hypothetical protein [Bacilli bacterium]
MEINLMDLNNQEKIIIDELISYSEEFLKTTEIISLNDVSVVGEIKRDYENNNLVKLDVSGQMYITDAITSEEVPYEFQIEIEEILENSLKTLDLIEFLWHYIVLEIPIRYTTSDTKELKDKYSDIYFEDEVKEINNPFKDFFKE